MSCWIGVLVWLWVCLLGGVWRNKFPCTISLDFFNWFGEEWNAPITKSQWSRAGTPSMRKPASRGIISALPLSSARTDVCFLNIQLIGTNVWLPNLHTSPPEVDFESSRSPAKARVLKQSQPALLCCISRMTILFELIYVMNVRDQTCQTFVACSGPFGDSMCKFVHGPYNVWSTNACQLQTFEDNLRPNFWQLSSRSHFFFLKLMVVKAWRSCDFV